MEEWQLPPDGYRPLAEHARSIGCKPDTARRAAQQGNIPGAVRVHVPGTPQPVWYVPANCPWRPRKVGRPSRTKSS